MPVDEASFCNLGYHHTSDNFLEFVRSIDVVNDSSERAVKLVQELIDRAHGEEKCQDGILYVNNYKR